MTLEEAADKLWEDRAYDERVKNLYRKAVMQIRQILSEYHADEIFFAGRGACQVAAQKIDCDYYGFLENDPEAVRAWKMSGGYLQEYSWAEETGAKVNIQHISTAGAVEAVRRSKKRGSRVTAEAAPHHFTLNEEAVLEYGTLAKMNPPLRTEEDRRAIIEAIADGTIEVIATDHAPHSEEEKAREFAKAPSGIIGLETSFAAGYTYLVKPGHLTLPKLIERMTAGPARLYSLNAGTLSEGAPADIVLIDTEEKWLVTDDFASKSKNSPYIGETLTGKVKMTICGGKVVYDETR